MSMLETLEESMKVLDVLSVFLSEESNNYIHNEEIRFLLEDVFEKIHEIYESLGDDSIIEEIRDKWESDNSEPLEQEDNLYHLDDIREEEE